MRVGWTSGFGERVQIAHGWAGLGRALASRRVEIVDVDEPSDEVRVAVLAAPAARMGPERVKAWRRWVDGGGRLLVLGLEGGDGPELTSDAGLTVPGMGLAAWQARGAVPVPSLGLSLSWSGSAFALRNSASLLPPDRERAGRLWPNGKGWFRFGRSHDVLEAWPLPDDIEVTAADGVDVRVGGWAWLHLGLRDGALLGLGDATALGDGRLAEADHVALLSHVLEAWLPAPEPGLCAALMAGSRRGGGLGDPGPVEAVDPLVRELVDMLLGAGVPLGEAGDAAAPLVARAPAFRALGDAGLLRWDGSRIALTHVGRDRIDVVAAVFDARAAARRQDAADRG